MKTSVRGLTVLELREGKRNKAYKDTKGIPTIGVGHTQGVQIGDVWTDAQVLENLAKDVEECEEAINRLVSSPLTQDQFDALVSFIFNVGVAAFERSTLLKMLNACDYAGAANQFDRWHIPIEITSRRNSEKQQFLS